jgi:cellulose synthase/poly-beta-1,6-N-acetylglucosamine synthase-like glycosyltransferase
VPPELGLVSVVMAAFNEEAFIGEAIESVVDQTYPRIELIVVDDGSTDETASIAAGFDGVHLVRHAHKGGVAAACNTGLAFARGEYWTLFDADDVMPPERLSCGVAHLQKLLCQVNVVSCNLWVAGLTSSTALCGLASVSSDP